MTGMKVSAVGLLSQSANLITKRPSALNQAKLYQMMLRQMVCHIEMVQNGEITLQEFAEQYCITQKKKPD